MGRRGYLITTFDSSCRAESKTMKSFTQNAFTLCRLAHDFMLRMRGLQGDTPGYDRWYIQKLYDGMYLPRIIYTGGLNDPSSAVPDIGTRRLPLANDFVRGVRDASAGG